MQPFLIDLGGNSIIPKSTLLRNWEHQTADRRLGTIFGHLPCGEAQAHVDKYNRKQLANAAEWNAKYAATLEFATKNHRLPVSLFETNGVNIRDWFDREKKL